MPIGLPHLVKDGDQPWSRDADENHEEVTLKVEHVCADCGHSNKVLGRYFIYRRTSYYIEDVCERGCLINRKRVKYT